MAQGGDIVKGDGTSGESIYGEYFTPEVRKTQVQIDQIERFF